MKKLFHDLKNSKIIHLAFCILFIVTILLSGCTSNEIDNDLSILKDCLLEPSSLIIYEAYTSDNYGDNGRATLFYFGAKNKAGGISDDWALVYDGSILFESNFNIAKETKDNRGVLEHGELIFAKFAVKMGSERWEEISIN